MHERRRIFPQVCPMAILSSRLVIPAVLIAAIPAGIALAQAPAMFHHERPSADMIARLQEGRIAMAKAALKLSDSQLKLWAPLEEQIRAAIADRAKARAEREQARQAAPNKDLAERLELRSQAMTQRAERMKAFTAAFKSLYASLTDEQKPLAGLVLRAIGGPHHHHHRFSHREQQ
jgi:LTXXQ motif family protein